MPPDPSDAPTDAASRPVRADVTTTATAGCVLVAVTLRNDTAVAVRVRVENTLDGPVLPPRREGVPAAGWDEGGFTGTVPADSRLGIGYACPETGGDAADGASADSNADPDSEAISFEILGPADEEAPSESDHVADAVRSLGRANPPADAVPSSPTIDPDGPDLSLDHPSRRRSESVEPAPTDAPPPIATWLDAVETRIRRAERLTDATADEAAAVLEDCGVDDVATLPDDLERDLASLRAVGDRIEEITARASEAEPKPVVSSLVAAAEGDPSATAEVGGTGTAHSANATTDPESGGTR